MAKVLKKFNLSVVTRKYTDQQGQEKSVWRTIGEMTVFQKEDGSNSTMAELYHMPGVTVSVFGQKEQKATPAPIPVTAPTTAYNTPTPATGEVQYVPAGSLPF